VKIAGLKNDFIVYLDIDEWDPGSYVFVAKAKEGDPPKQMTTSLEFFLGYTAAMLTRHFERTMEALALIATPEEIEGFKRAPVAERARFWGTFWVKRDPSPGTADNEALVEHLRRVRYAVENFPDGGAGWQSDRGKVYIKYGEPDHKEVRIDSGNQGEYLIWHYYKQSLTFVFYDRMGLGEYHLTDTSQL
jgi:GWxTD domain-containing protein